MSTQYVYDPLGRTAGTKTTGSTDWSCTTYDTRGRTMNVVTAAAGSMAGWTAAFGYKDPTTGDLKRPELVGGS